MSMLCKVLVLEDWLALTVAFVMQAEVSRRLLAHCELLWEDGVLDFHATQRTVQTASLGQARPSSPLLVSTLQ